MLKWFRCSHLPRKMRFPVVDLQWILQALISLFRRVTSQVSDWAEMRGMWLIWTVNFCTNFWDVVADIACWFFLAFFGVSFYFIVCFYELLVKRDWSCQEHRDERVERSTRSAMLLSHATKFPAGGMQNSGTFYCWELRLWCCLVPSRHAALSR